MPLGYKEVVELVISTGGIKYGEEQMHLYKDKALTILNKFPESDAKSSLELLVNYSIERDK